MIRDIKIIDGLNGYFVSMPSKKTQQGKFVDMIHPVDRANQRVHRRDYIDRLCEGQAGRDTTQTRHAT